MSLNFRSQRKTTLLRRIGRWTGGILLVLVGLVFSFPGVPGPGLLLVAFGVMVLLPESRWLQKKYAKVKRRYPRVFAKIEKWTRRKKPRNDRGGSRRAA